MAIEEKNSALAEEALDRDKRLIEACLEGRKEAWETFIQQYTRLVYYAIQKIGRFKGFPMSEADIEDLHNQLFLSLMEKDFHKLRQFQGHNQCRLSTWIGLIATRKTLDYYGKKRHRDRSLDQMEMQGESMAAENIGAQEQILQEEKRRLLSQAVAEFPSKERLFYRMVFIEERDPQEIAELLATSISNVYSRKSRMIAKLREIIMQGG